VALKAFKDPAFKPEDAGDNWNSTERLKCAGRLFAVYNTALNALMVAQEGERRAHWRRHRRQQLAAVDVRCDSLPFRQNDRRARMRQPSAGTSKASTPRKC
jgi:hypothetical protein